MSEEEKKRLDQLGCCILQDAGFISQTDGESVNYATIKQFGYYGYGHYYMQKCWNESKMTNETDAAIYRQLIEIDSVLGTNTTIQLLTCCLWTTRCDIIQV